MQQILSNLNSLSTPALISVSILPVLFAITLHEVAHGWIAKHLGDPTAQRLGRLTLNPVKHIDPIGTILLPATMIFLKLGFVLGWAKPVPITWENLRHPKRDMVLVAVAGPGANFLMAMFWGLIAKIAVTFGDGASWVTIPLLYMGLVGIFVNALLMVFNLLPVPPLDGGRVAVGLLPGRWGWTLSRVEPYGFFIVIGIMMTPVFGLVVYPAISAVMAFVVFLSGLA